MLILGIESSSLTAGAAVLRDNIVVAEYNINFKKTHSQTLLPMIDEVLKMAEIKPEELDAVAVSAGPGSFTGLRIGSATAKGLCLAVDIPLAEVSTIEAMAYSCYGFNGLVCPVIDARRSQVYTGIYSFSEGEKAECILEPCVMQLEELAEKLNGMGKKVIFTGDGILTCRDYLTEHVPEGNMAPPMCSSPRAASVAYIGARMAAEGKLINSRDHQPVYLKKSQAEREREEGIYTKGSLKPGETGTELHIR